MPHKINCPHCSESVEVKGVVTRETLKEQVGAKDAEITQLRDALTTARTEAGDVSAIRAERDRYAAQIAEMEAAATISTAFTQAGVPDDEGIRSGFRAIYQSATAGMDADEKPSLADWIAGDDAKAHPLLAGHYQGAQGDGEGSSSTQGTHQGASGSTSARAAGQSGARPPGLPDGNNGASAPGQTQIRSAQDLAAYFNSPEYRSLPREERAKRRAELKTQMGEVA